LHLENTIGQIKIAGSGFQEFEALIMQIEDYSRIEDSYHNIEAKNKMQYEYIIKLVKVLELIIRLFISFERIKFTRLDSIEIYIQQHIDKEL